MLRDLPDHGLPLVQLKEQRRELIVAFQNRTGPVSGWELMQIAAVQQAIQAFEEVIADLDAEAEMEMHEAAKDQRSAALAAPAGFLIQLSNSQRDDPAFPRHFSARVAASASLEKDRAQRTPGVLCTSSLTWKVKNHTS